MKFYISAIAAIVCSIAALGAAYANESKQIHIEWAVDVDQRAPNSPKAFSAPVVVSQGDSSLVVLGGRDSWVHVYNIKGSEVRRFKIDDASDSGALALGNGLVVLGDIAGRLYGVDPVKGSVVWKAQLTASFTSVPVTVGDGFLVQTTDNRIYRFTQDGEKLWSYAGQENIISMYMGSSPLVKENRIYAVFNNGDAVALKADSGDLVWKRPVLLSNDFGILSELKAPLSTPMLLANVNMGGESSENTLMIAFFQGDLVALSAENGAQVFSLPTSLKSAPAVRGAILYTADSAGFFHGYDIVKGKRLWSNKISDAALMGPVLLGNALWAADEKGLVYSLNKNGQVQASVELVGQVTRAPVVTSAGLLVRTDRGMMYMVNK
ncbi:MAG: PQQ-binding-like beta-propeller repeat protein [Ghiorsea sp.]